MHELLAKWEKELAEINARNDAGEQRNRYEGYGVYTYDYSGAVLSRCIEELKQALDK